MNIGDAYLKMSNTEDLSSLIIFRVDDVFEISPKENVYECTVINFKNDEERPYSIS